MEIGTTLYVKHRRQWRAWLAKHHRTAPEIWLIYGWIDAARPRREVFRQRLRHFLKMTAQNKRFGMVQ